MRKICFISAFVTALTLAQTESTSLRVETVFAVETPEGIEAAIVDGYPMPWLAEILADESIPDEDRYWLDCRVRAAIAMDLHTFFDREGNAVSFEADWIRPGEGYWRENFIMNKIGVDYNTLPFQTCSDQRVEPGLLISLYGECIGEFAHSGITGNLDTPRDGSFAAGVFPIDGKYHLVLLYSDGTFFVSPIEIGYATCGVSQSGQYIILAARGVRDPWGLNDIPPEAILFDRCGRIVWETELEFTPMGNSTPVISSDDRYCAIASYAPGELGVNRVQVFDVETGIEAWRIENPNAVSLSFSPNSSHLAVSGIEAMSLNMQTGEIEWTDRLISRDAFPVARIMYLHQSNSGELVSGMVWPSERSEPELLVLALFDRLGNVLARDNIFGNTDISPNGVIVITENYQHGSDRTATPIVIRRVFRAGE